MKRFLSIFAIMALVVSMFSGVAFAAEGANQQYTLANATVGEYTYGVDKEVDIDVTAAGTGSDLADLTGFTLGVYTADGTLQKNAAGTDITADLDNAGNATFAAADIGDLDPGTYYVQLASAHVDGETAADSQNQYKNFQVEGYVLTDDITYVVYELVVKDAYDVVLDVDSVVYNSDNTIATIPGKIINGYSKALAKIDGRVSVFLKTASPDAATHAGNLYSIEFSDGEFELKVYPSVLSIGKFQVVGFEGTYGSDTYTYTDANYRNTGDFRVMFGMELSEPSELEFTYPVTGQIVVSGVFTNEDAVRTWAAEDGNPIDETDVELYHINDDGTLGTKIAVASFADSKSFGFIFDGTKILGKGDIGIFIKDQEGSDHLTLAMEGEAVVGTFDVSMTDEVQNNLGDQNIAFDFELPTKYVDGDDLDTGYTIDWSIKDESDNGTFSEFDTNKGSEQILTETVDFTSYTKGEYTVEFELIKGGKVELTGETTFDVVSPENFNLVGFTTEEHKVGDFQFEFDIDGTAKDSETDQEITVKKKDGTKAKYVEAKFEGCGVDKTFISADYETTVADKDNIAKITTTETGTLKVTINVYSDDEDTDTTPDDTFTKEIKITGWNVEVTSSKVTVDTEEDITFTIVDHEGNPVNNAYIVYNAVDAMDAYAHFNTSLNAKILVDGRKTNINGGVYTYSEDAEGILDSVGKVKLYFVYDKDASTHELMVTSSSAIEVVGKEVYTVTSDKGTLLNGVKEEILVEVLNDEGDVVYPTFTRVDVDADDDETDGTLSVGSRKDVDGDGVKESVAITVTPNKDEVEMVIRATTDGGKNMGEVRITVQTPEVVMTGAKNFTNNFNTEFEFQVIDPRDNSVMDNTVKFENNSSDYIADPAVVDTKSLDLNDEVWTGTYLVKEAKFDDAEKDEKDIAVDLVMEGDSSVEVKLLAIPVVAPSLTATPESVIMGSGANITLTYKDAEGNPLKEREIKVGVDKELVGETNENGTLLYATASSNSMSMVFNAETDAEDSTPSPIYTELKVKSVADVNGPTVTFEVVGKTAIITVTDESLISATYVDGQEVKMYFPSKTVTHTVKDLKVGSNVVSVITADVHYNPTMAELDIVVEATAEPISFTLNVATDLGTPVMVEGNTMVPVRFAQDLGATFEYNAETETATYTLGETVISVTVGSTTAVVNGVNTQLPVAPYMNDLDRMMVPVRMIAEDLGFTVNYVSETEPITITQ